MDTAIVDVPPFYSLPVANSLRFKINSINLKSSYIIAKLLDTTTSLAGRMSSLGSLMLNFQSTAPSWVDERLKVTSGRNQLSCLRFLNKSKQNKKYVLSLKRMFMFTFKWLA